jgi:xanthine dehydrogenase small subunit
MDHLRNDKTTFLLNETLICTDKPSGMVLLDFVRYHQHLKGTKIGCREGDCGACTLLIGELSGDKLRYRSATSCLTALGNIHLKHVVTVEGLNGEGLNPLQQAICEEGGTQCGFCTPGFIVSMAGLCLGDGELTYQHARAAVDGNICRCTGYKSIERALLRVTELLQGKAAATDRLAFLVDLGILPPYFRKIRQRLDELSESHFLREGGRFLGGGTDLYVQQHEAMVNMDIQFLNKQERLKGIWQEGQQCMIGASATVTDLMESSVIQSAFSGFDQYARLISSTPIRNIATIAGNFVNASPIGDLTVFFLALDAKLWLSDGRSIRELPLRSFYLGYKQLNKRPEEYIERISFALPGPDEHFHFEKVSKRTCLDIASVNTAMLIRVKGERVEDAHISAGGVGPVPAYLEHASAMLKGQPLGEGIILACIKRACTEIAPISDARGTADYKSLLLGQLIKAHFLTLFPALQAKQLLET